MQKKGLNRESFIQKFPDSERGEMKSRASFLGGDAEDEMEESNNIRSFKNLQQLTMSPTIGDKTPFSKTPRAKMGTDPEGEDEADSSPRGMKQTEKDEKEKDKDKKNLIGKFLSKHRNKK